MATDKSDGKRLYQHYLQELGMHGLSAEEAEHGQGDHVVRTIGPAQVLPAYAYVRRCKASGRHVAKPGVCINCAKTLEGLSKDIVIKRVVEEPSVVPGAGGDEDWANPLSSAYRQR